MIYVEEINDDIKVSGQLVSISKSAIDKFVVWQNQMKRLSKEKFSVISVQKTNTGVFVVYEK
jgi:hypothetical protein